MKLLFTVLLSLLLSGCSPAVDAPPPETGRGLTPVTELPQSPYGNTVEAVSLPLENVEGIFPREDGLLLAAGRELLLLDGSGRKAAALTLPFEGRIFVRDSVISAFDPEEKQLVLLDTALSESRRLQLPADVSGCPVLNGDGSALFYCTDSGLYHWDLDSGIRRRIRETSHPGQTLVDLHWNDSVLQCRLGDRELFVDAATGQLLKEMGTPVRLLTEEDRYYCAFTAGFVENLIFGTDSQSPRTLHLTPENCFFLPKSYSAVTLDGLLLCCYDLDSGQLRETLTLDQPPLALAEGSDGCVYLLLPDNVLLKWRPAEAVGGEDHTAIYFTAEAPDEAGLTLCRDYAQALSLEYGLDIRVWKDAVAQMPWDYQFTPEHRYPVVLQQLQTLERCLRRFPKALLAQTTENYDRFAICLVQSITGTVGVQSLTTATGIQFQNGSEAYLVLSAGAYQEQALYHELFHVMETHILSRSGALDRWNELNPAGFSYDLDLQANASRNSGVYLENGTRAFIDTYSMSYPREDRARIFEYAMLPDKSHLFRSEIMQRKLSALCASIREAYDLETTEQPLPWEQYLE